MEVVGVVAAIPGLIEIIQGLTTAVRGLAKGKVTTKAAEELLLELKDLEETLKDLQSRWRQNPLGQSQLQRLSPALAQLRAELSSIKDKLQSSKITKDPVRFFQKAVFLTTSLEKTLKESLSRLTQAKTSLTLILAHHHDRQARELLEVSYSDLRLKLRTLLRPSNHSFIPRKVDQTCEWVWSHAVFIPWLSKSPSLATNHLDHILCLYGIKGCGKSVLVKSIAERLKDKGEIALHFSFWAGSETQRKLLDLLRTMLWQLFSHLPDVQVQQLSTPLVTEPSLNEHNVLDVVQKALRLIQSDVYCMIDGIDESTDNWTSRRDRCLQTVFALVEQHPKIHLLVSGREPTMRTLLKESPPTIEVTESLVQHDMRRFIAVELQDALTIQNAEVEELVRTTLEAKSQIMFLWATLVFKELRRCYSIREIKKTLGQVPRDLDREYYRLFQQLMDRTGGTLTKPSVSMKRAHRILSTILASAEPLTAQELCYAYAAQENTSGNIEDDLIAVEGITDSCGDFLRVTEGRYHLVHTSTADFLTRPAEEWRDEDSDIEYFRVDLGDAQQSMCVACLGYMNTLDWGYPLTDNGARDLPSKYPFFLYSTEFLPYHLAEALDLGRGSWVNAFIAQFVGTRQACFLVEYVTFIVQNGLQDGEMGDIVDLLYWLELLDADIDLPTSSFIHAYQNELEHRGRQFGLTDSRYESWRALSLLFPEDLLQKRDFQPLADLSKSSKLVSGMRETPFRALPDFLAQSPDLSMRNVFQKVQAVSIAMGGFKETVTDLMALSMNSLPAPMVFLCEALAVARDDWPTAQRLATICLRKSRGKGNLIEAASLLDIAVATYRQDGKNWGDIEDMVWQALDILDHLPPQPQNQFYKLRALIFLAHSLIDQVKEVANETACRLRDLIGKGRKKTDNRMWEYILNTVDGIQWRMNFLSDVAQHYLDKENYAEAVSWVGEAVAVGEGSGDTQCLRALEVQRDVFYHFNDTQKCVAVSLKILDLLESSGRDQKRRVNHRYIQCQTQDYIGASLARQGDVEEARSWYCKAADGVISIPTDEQHPVYTEDIDNLPRLATDLALLGEYERSELTSLKFLQLRKCFHEDRTTQDFQNIGSLVEKLRRLGSIALDYQRLLHCFSLSKTFSMQLQKIKDPMGPEIGAEWWETRERNLDIHFRNFRQNWAILCLKCIDTRLSQDEGLEEASYWYENLGKHYAEVGDLTAAEVVLSDVASRYLADFSLPFSTGLKLASKVFLYQRRFPQRRVLLLSANEAWMNSAYPNLYNIFSRESYLAKRFTEDAELLAELSAASDLQASFVHQACEHLTSARDANDQLEEGDHDGLDKDAAEDQNRKQKRRQKRRQKRILDLEDRLKLLGSGPLPPKVTDGNQDVTNEDRNLRRVKSVSLPGPARPLRRRLSLGLY